MRLRQHGRIFLNGLIVLVPILITVYVAWTALWGLDMLVRKALKPVWTGPMQGLSEAPVPGIGILVGVVAIYAVGLLARSWLLRWPLRIAEGIVERIPLVKSLYSAVRDLLQFLGGQEAASRGRPCVWKAAGGRTHLLGLITQERPQKFLPGDEEGRIAVYLPMSYQLGGFTFFVPAEEVEELEDMTVEELLKLALTAGIGAKAMRVPPALRREQEQAGRAETDDEEEEPDEGD
jgi:uncharacterized membrane protein